MMNKKLSMLALGVTLLLALSACGAEAKQSEPVEKNIVVSDSSNEESEIGLIETESPNTNTDVSVKESEGMSDKELYFYFQLSFDSCITYENNTYEDQLKLELQTLRDYCSFDSKQLPSDYASRYESWRSQQSDSRYAAADITSSSESQQTLEFSDCSETVYAVSQVNLRTGPGTSYDKVGSLSTGNSAVRTGIGYNSCDGWSRIQLSDGNTVYVSSKYISTSKPAAQQQVSTPSNGGYQQSTPSASKGTNSNLADPSLITNDFEIYHPNAGKTQEQLEKEWEIIDELNKDVHFQ